MRVFIAIEFNDEVKNYLKQVQEVVKLGCTKGNFTRYENFHITLRYIGETDNAGIDNLCDLIDTVSSELEAFEIKLGDLGLFKSRNKSIVWQGIVFGKNKLNNLYQEIEKKIEDYGFERETRKYKPHVTLARQTEFINVSVIETIPLLSEPINVKRISLMLSARENDVLKYTTLYRKEF